MTLLVIMHSIAPVNVNLHCYHTNEVYVARSLEATKPIAGKVPRPSSSSYVTANRRYCNEFMNFYGAMSQDIIHDLNLINMQLTCSLCHAYEFCI